MKVSSTYNPKKIARIVKRHEKRHRKRYAQTGEIPIITIVEWCFYIRVKWNPDWFSYWWRVRNSNALIFQVWKFWIEIGVPWHDDVLRGAFFDYKGRWPTYLDDITQGHKNTRWPGWIFHQVYELKNEFEHAEIKQ